MMDDRYSGQAGKHNGPFSSDAAVDEQIEHLLRVQEGESSAATTNARIIREVREVYQEDEQILQRTWQRLSERITQPANTTIMQKDRKNVQKKQINKGEDPPSSSERPHAMDQAYRIEGLFPPAQPVSRRPRRTLRQQLSVIAAVLVAAVLIGSLIGILVQVQQQKQANPNPTETTNNIVPGETPTQQATEVPAVETSCPAPGQARAAVLPGLGLGATARVAYYTNAGTAGGPSSATVWSYNTSTGQSEQILALPATWINSAQLSFDGRWVLLSVNRDGQVALQLLRIDGRFLQTLYCAASGQEIWTYQSGPQWSHDLKNIVFSTYTLQGNTADTYLLHAETGVIDRLLTTSNAGVYAARTWQDASHVYLSQFLPNSGAPAMNLYVVDINDGADQPVGGLQTVVDTTNIDCWGFDSSFEAGELVHNQCTYGTEGGPGNGRIDRFVQGTPQLLFNGPYAISDVQSYERGTVTKLLVSVHNNFIGSLDHDSDGIYLFDIATGSFTLLAAYPYAQLNQNSQYGFANVSWDEQFYAVKPWNGDTTDGLAYGSLNGGDLTTFAIHPQMDQVELIGWTLG